MIAHESSGEPHGHAATKRRSRRGLLLAVALVLGLRLFVAEQFVVESGSMKPTLVKGDYLLVSKLAYGLRVPFTKTHLVTWDQPERGDVIVFVGDDGRSYVKRVVGLPGDTVSLEDNRVRLGGETLPVESLGRFENWRDESRVLPLKQLRAERLREKLGGRWHLAQVFDRSADFEPVTVAPGHLFVLGDNRDDSRDSRMMGQVPIGAVSGRAKWIWWSFGHREGRRGLVPIE